MMGEKYSKIRGHLGHPPSSARKRGFRGRAENNVAALLGAMVRSGLGPAASSVAPSGQSNAGSVSVPRRLSPEVRNCA